jgi:phosphatidylinositol glycan class Z
MLLGVYLDTIFYNSEPHSLSTLARHPVFTPLNNLIYNANPQNLAQHGLHPYYQHLVANLPLLLGPAYLLIFGVRRLSISFVSAASGLFLLSLVRHQEARFLVPAVPLFLSSVRPPRQFFRAWVALWIAYNAFMGIFMGIYHQGGIIPTQNFLAGQDRIAEVLWWRTYSPPTWLLDGKIEQIKTTVLMGMPPELMVQELARVTTCHLSTSVHANDTFLVAPESSAYLDPLTGESEYGDLRLQRVWHYPRHLNLDDLDIAREGFRGTLKRVVGRRGLTTWRVSRQCA